MVEDTTVQSPYVLDYEAEDPCFRRDIYPTEESQPMVRRQKLTSHSADQGKVER